MVVDHVISAPLKKGAPQQAPTFGWVWKPPTTIELATAAGAVSVRAACPPATTRRVAKSPVMRFR